MSGNYDPFDSSDAGRFDIPPDEGPTAEEALPVIKFHNLEAEAALLGGLMVDNRFVGEISERVRQKDFYSAMHGRIYKAIVHLVGSGRTANPITLRPLFAMDADMNSEKIGGAGAYLAELTGSGAVLIGIRDFANQVAELARMRAIHAAMVDSLNRMQTSGQVAEATGDLEAAIWAAADRHKPIRILGAGDMIGLAQERITRIQTGPTGTVGATCRTIPELNTLLGGLEGGQYTIVAARPSMGKTTLALSAAWGYAANGHPTFYAHAEMSSELIALKVASDISFSRGKGILFDRVKKGTTDRYENGWLSEAREMADQLPLRYGDIGRADIMRLDALVARQCAYWEARDRKLQIVFVDYIGLLTVAGARPGDDRVRVSQISKGLLDIAKKYGVHVVALAQLSRGLEQRTDKRPMLSDLRDSGDLEQDADAVVFLYRHEWYLSKEKPKRESEIADWEIDMADCKGKVEIIAEKNRLGERGWRKAKFYGEYSAVRGLAFNDQNLDDEDDFFANWGGNR